MMEILYFFPIEVIIDLCLSFLTSNVYLLQIVGRDGVCYYHDMIQEMIKWGYQEGKTLFGFGYDFRQSNR